MEGILTVLFDSKAHQYGAPEVQPNAAVALRAFETILNSDRSSVITQHPEDFTLFKVASFKDDLVEPCAKVALANGLDLKKVS